VNAKVDQVHSRGLGILEILLPTHLRLGNVDHQFGPSITIGVIEIKSQIVKYNPPLAPSALRLEFGFLGRFRFFHRVPFVDIRNFPQNIGRWPVRHEATTNDRILG
jgi:hypothetical protein